VVGSGKSSTAGIIDLGYALRAGLVEFYLQPKISLRRKQVVGVEMFVRARHPLHGVLQAPALIAGADNESLGQLAAFGVRTAQQISRTLANSGARIPITINVPSSILVVRQISPIFGTWGSTQGTTLILDVPEEEMLSEFARIPHVAAELGRLGIKLAIDNFGRSLFGVKHDVSSENFDRGLSDLCGQVVKLKVLGLAELKLDRNFIEDCGSDPRRKAMCKTVIDLIHHLGASAVAIGLTKQSDAAALDEMGCDVGQGNLFSEPLPLNAFLGLLQEKSKRQKSGAAPAGPSKTVPAL
jgi:EAL domain-containing protein (putative c-di-GMP-specific phosphodiesterase class I)